MPVQPTFLKRNAGTFDSKGHRIFPRNNHQTKTVTPPSHRASVGVVPSQVETVSQKRFLLLCLGSAVLVGLFQQCRLDTMEHRECASVDATPAILNWAPRGVEKVTALFSSTPAVTERPATPLSTRRTRPGGNSILLILYPLSSADRPETPHQQDGSFLVFENSSLNHIL